jgi:hypothetical protein
VVFCSGPVESRLSLFFVPSPLPLSRPTCQPALSQASCKKSSSRDPRSAGDMLKSNAEHEAPITNRHKAQDTSTNPAGGNSLPLVHTAGPVIQRIVRSLKREEPGRRKRRTAKNEKGRTTLGFGCCYSTPFASYSQLSVSIPARFDNSTLNEASRRSLSFSTLTGPELFLPSCHGHRTQAVVELEARYY